MSSTNRIAELQGVKKTYARGGVPVRALRGVHVSIVAGEYAAIMGPSGSGKSTLLHILGCLDQPTSGRYFLEGRDVSRLSDRELSSIRNRKLGFVFQAYNLISHLTVRENVEIPLFYMGVPPKERYRRSMRLVEMVGLKTREWHRPTQLSGGEAQRTAIARALVNDPVLILADEPTGNLDSKTGEEILGVFDELHSHGSTIVTVTHDRAIGARADRVISISDGMIVNGAPVVSDNVVEAGSKCGK